MDGKMRASELAKRERYRELLLEGMWEVTKGNPMHSCNLAAIAERESIPYEELRAAYHYFLQKRLIKPFGNSIGGYMTAYGVDTVERIISKRLEQQYKLLREFYRAIDGRTEAALRSEAMTECASRMGVPEADADLAWDRLCRDGLLVHVAEDLWQITLEGAHEVEASIKRPHEGTDHFPAPVVQHVTNTTNNYQINAPVGALQSGAGNTANVVQNVALGDEVVRAFAGLRQAAQQLDGEDRQDTEELIDALEEQSKSPNPKKGVMKQCTAGIIEKLKPIDVVAFTSVILRAIEMAQHLSQ